MVFQSSNCNYYINLPLKNCFCNPQLRTKICKLSKKCENFRKVNPRYHAESFLGEIDGHFAVIMILEARNDDELVEIFNGSVIEGIKSRHGKDCIRNIITAKVTFPLRVHHNYIPIFNMEKGIIKKDWLNEWIFVPNAIG